MEKGVGETELPGEKDEEEGENKAYEISPAKAHSANFPLLTLDVPLQTPMPAAHVQRGSGSGSGALLPGGLRGGGREPKNRGVKNGHHMAWFFGHRCRQKSCARA